MKALTLWQPWSWAIAHAGKRVENRSWPPPRWAIGQRIAIHAGKKLDEDAELGLGFRHRAIMPEQYVHGAVEAVATVFGWIDKKPSNTAQAEWWAGPCGWVLVEVIALPRPVPCRGAQKLWDLPADVEAAVLAQEAELRAQIEEVGHA